MDNGAQHYVIIGTGPAGDEAAWHVRQRDPDAAISMITAGRLLYIRRYHLHRVFSDLGEWRELLVHPPEYFDDNRIKLRRNTFVSSVDPERKILGLRHREELRYDKLLVAAGGGGYVPEGLREHRDLIHGFGDYEDAVRLRQALPDGGRVLMLGGDMMGIELARHLVKAGYRVTIVASEQLFWPHEIEASERPRYVEALERMNIEVVQGKKVTYIEEGARGLAARRLLFDDDEEQHGDVVMSFCGLMPSLNFMSNAGLHIERGLLVSPELATINDSIWAAGDVCQIWSPETKRYRCSYEWKSVRNMGRVAAVNMTGGNENIDTFHESELTIDADGALGSPFWDYD
jgi:NAD(P)H-nitrite reductase large subunit